jgi:hypothetical protein
MINNIITAVVIVLSVSAVVCVAAVIQTISEERKERK